MRFYANKFNNVDEKDIFSGGEKLNKKHIT